jgi:tRNA methyltransferase complex GCD14 subunit
MNRLTALLHPGLRRMLLIVLPAVLVIVVLALPFITGPKPVREPPLVERLACPRSRSSPPVETIIHNLNLQPGMRVLVVGNTDPHLSLSMAEAVGTKGSVVVADFDSQRNRQTNQMAKDRGLHNLSAVTITPEWDQAFYRNRQFDLVLLDDVFDRLPDPRTQLAGFKQTLSGQAARVFMLRAEFLPPFSESMGIDAGRVIDVLRKQGQQSPFYARLPGELKSLVGATQPSAAIDPAAYQLVIGFLNTCLADQGLYADVDRYYALKSEIPNEYMKHIKLDREVHLLQYLLYNFTKAFDKGAVPANPQEKLAVYTANHILLTSILTLPKTFPFYSEISFYCSNPVLQETFEAAGFRKVGYRELSPQYSLWAFEGDLK